MAKKADMGKRIIAGLIDLAIVASASTMLMFVASSIMKNNVTSWLVLFPIVYFLYEIIMDLGNKGQTFGKMASGVTVFGEKNMYPSAVDFSVRTIVKVLPYFAVALFPNIWYITGTILIVCLLFPLFRTDKRALYDLVSDSVVINKENIKELLCEGETEEDSAEVSVSGLGQTSSVVVAENKREVSSVETNSQVAEKVEERPIPAATPKRRKAVLICVAGELRGMLFQLDRELLIGRDRSCNIVFSPNTPEVSRQHCKIRYDEEHNAFILGDMSSTYGTFLGNGKKLAKGGIDVLRSEDEFYIGTGQRFLVRSVEE